MEFCCISWFRSNSQQTAVRRLITRYNKIFNDMSIFSDELECLMAKFMNFHLYSALVDSWFIEDFFWVSIVSVYVLSKYIYIINFPCGDAMNIGGLVEELPRRFAHGDGTREPQGHLAYVARSPMEHGKTNGWKMGTTQVKSRFS